MGNSEPRPPTEEAKLSIYQLARLYCRERLLVDPFLWTSRHVELLQFTFGQPTNAPSLKQDERQPTCLPEKHSRPDLVRKLLQGAKCGWMRREFDMLKLMTAPGSPFVSVDDLTFHFKGYCIRTLECLIFCRGEDPEAAMHWYLPPVAAFLDREHVGYQRSQFVHTGSSGSRSGRQELRRKRRRKIPQTLALAQLKKLTPPNALHDPCIVALLISLAQGQRHHLRVVGREREVDAPVFLAQVLFLDPDDTRHLHLFSADISSSFLEKFDFPAVPPSPTAQTSVLIRHTVVPFEPFETFQHRIFELLLPTLEVQKQNSKGEGTPPRPGNLGEGGGQTGR
ncbi:hypothetical protein FQN55_007190 [Onygenales sp. PD_40]|nr:hypothetical protein FQN55_007190 [Onygenales sp. PD_40]KAK2780812.1 hypothetical protein FQN52_002073 [Onygenales sp. PD_12]